MTDKKRVVSLCLSLILVFSFAGCKNKEDTKTEKPNNEIVSEEKSQTENNSIVGTWVVEKTEVYEGPIKAVMEQIAETYYYVGAEYEFTADGVFKNADGTITTNYSILNDNQILMKVVVGNTSENINDYELNGDEFILYGCYTGSNADLYADLGYPSATYFKRK